jgi:hypothetical protein
MHDVVSPGVNRVPVAEVTVWSLYQSCHDSLANAELHRIKGTGEYAMIPNFR